MGMGRVQMHLMYTQALGLTSNSKIEQPAQTHCDSCLEDYAKESVLRTHCGHGFCVDCLTELFTSSMTDVTLFPPRCCRQVIPLEEAEPFIGSNVAIKWQARKVEFETPDKIYCATATCAAFLTPDQIVDGVGTCNSCLASTCVTCKNKDHPGEDCPEDQGIQAILELACENGWQRCSACRSMIELNTGCNHIL